MNAGARPLVVAVRGGREPEAGRCIEALRARGVRIVPFPAPPQEDLDLVLDLTARRIDPRHLFIARFGYWSFLYGETPERIPAGLPEWVRGERAAHVQLARLLPGGRAVILREGSVKVVCHSLARTRRRMLDAVCLWPAQLLGALADSSWAPEGPLLQLRRRDALARGALWAALPVALLRNLARRSRQGLIREEWRIGILEQPIERVVEDFDPAAIEWLEVPYEGFLADPFGRRGADGSLTVLAEAFSWKAGRGRIAAIERRAEGSVSVTPTSLEFDTHLSYPHLLEHGGQIYCIPESAARGRVELYRALAFPHRWELERVLLEDFPGADTTVTEYQGRWWMFTCNHVDQDEAKLFVFHAAAPRGPWTAHALNPVKCDVRSARPAGTPFVGRDGALYRPAQDGSRVYGGSIVVNRVSRLTPQEFSEEVVTRLDPDPHGPCPDGLHTLSAAGDLTLIDGKRHRLALPPWTGRLDRKARTLRRWLLGHGQDCLHQPAS